MSVIVIEFITLDGIVSDPDGSGGHAGRRLGVPARPRDGRRRQVPAGRHAGWGVLLLGRATWQLFSRLWPGRDDPFSARMNAVPKLVATRTLTDTSAWANSQVIDGDLTSAVKREPRDVIITGSLSVVHALMTQDLIDEYRPADLPHHPRRRGAAVRRRQAARLPGDPVGRAGRSRRPHPVPEGTMTARFLALYETPADPEAFDRHYHQTHIPLIRRLPGLRRYTLGRNVTALHGAPCYLVAELEWDTMDELQAAFATSQGRATAADAARLQELAPVRRMIFTADDTAG